MSQRITYIDIAKGLLIGLLCFHHFPQAVKAGMGIEDGNYAFVGATYQFYACFFMQAFFITGLCSNFYSSDRLRGGKLFIIKQIRTLIIPALLFLFIGRVVSFVLWNHSWQSLLNPDMGFWFLYALFFCKLLMYLCLKVIPERWQVVGLLLLSLVMMRMGPFFCFHFPDIWNWFDYQNCLVMFFFLCLGVIAKRYLMLYEKSLPIGFVTFCMLLILHFTVGIKMPFVTHGINDLDVIYIPNYILTATSGTFAVLYVSRLIGNCRVLEKLGQRSLLVYGFHFMFLTAFAYLIIRLLHVDMQTEWQVSLCFFVSCTLTLLASYWTAGWISKTEKLKIFTGK